MSVDLKTLTPDTTLPQDGVLFGADSQAAASPSVYPVSNVKTAMNSGIATLAGGNSIFWDMGANPVATVTLTDNATLYVSNYNAGGTYKLVVFQNITGNWTLSYDPNIKWPNNTAPTVSTAANAMTVLEFVSDGTFIYGTVSQAYDGWAPTVSSLFARPAGDYSTLPSTSTMPTGGSISRAGNAMLYDNTGQLTYAPNNVALQSQTLDVTGTWGQTAATVSANVTTAPDGTLTADALIESNTSAYHFLQQNITTVGNVCVYSVYAKQGSGSRKLVIREGVYTGAYGTFDLTTGTVAASGSGGTASISSVGNGWYRCSVAFVTSSGTSTIQFSLTNTNAFATYTGDGTSSLYLWGAQVEYATYQTTPSTYVATTTSAYYGPRFDYDPRPSLTGTASIAGSAVTLPAIFNDGTPASSVDNAYIGQTITVGGTGYPVTAYVGSTRIATVTGTPTSGSQSFTLTNPGYLLNRGLLVEGTRTNLVTYGAMAATWSGLDCSVAFSQTTTPDGTTSGLRITNTNGNALHRVYSEAFNLTTATTYTASMYVKSGTRTKGCIYIAASNEADVGFGECDFDLVAQTATAANGALSASITPVGNSWYRVTVTGRSNAASCRLFASTNVARLTSYSGDGETLFAYGAQVELGAFATSFTPTVASSVARAAETFSLTGYANRLVEAFYIDEQTGANFSGNSALSTGTVTISPPTFGWVTSLRAYTNAYAGSISTPSWLSFSRAGNAMYYDSTGTLTFAANNLLLNTATLSTQTVTTGIIPTCDVILSFKGTGSVAISGGYTGTLAGTGASDRVFLKFTTTTASLTFTVTGTVTEAQLERVTYQTQPSLYVANTGSQSYGPRYDFDPSTVPATPRGLLIEESRANSALYSQQFDNVYWSKSNLVTTGTPAWVDVAVAPDGTQTAEKLIATASSAEHLVTRGGYTAGANTFSVYFKAGEQTRAAIYFYNATDGLAVTYIDLVAGTASGSGKITSVGNGWFRCSLSRTSTVTDSIFFGPSAAATTVFTGDAVGGIFVWGAQLEAGSFATSYIPTTTASVTRAADVAQLTGSALTVGQGASGSAIAQFDSSRIWQGSYLVSFDNSATAQYYNFIAVTASRSDVLNNNVTQASLTYSPAPSVNTTARAAFAWAANNFAAVANNGTVQPDTSGTVPTGITTGYLGYYRDNLAVNGHIQSLALYNQRLPDAILAQKSTVGAPY